MKKERKISDKIKLVLLLFGISLLLWNCEKEEIIPIQQEINLKTVSKNEALKVFSQYKKNKHLQNKNASKLLKISPDWDTFKQEPLEFTSEVLSNVETSINIDVPFKMLLIFIKINNKLVKAIESTDADTYYANGKIKKGKVYYHNFEGDFLIGYLIKEGKVLKRLLPKKRINTASMVSLFTIFQAPCDEGYDPSNTFCNNELEEVVINGSSGGGSTYHFIYDVNYWDWEGGSNGIDTGEGNEDTDGGGNNSDDPNSCPPGKTYNLTTGTCECPAGKVEDSNGNCVDKRPCIGDPVLNPQIAAQTNSGIRGGMFGKTRSGGTQPHYGLDLKNAYGKPIYALYNGTGRIITQTKKGKVVGAGHYVEVSSYINGKNVKILYFHMQQNNRKSGIINAGDIIGYQGDSGNLKNAINQKLSVSHLHLKIKENGIPVDPITYLKTKIDASTGQVITPCN